MVNDVGLIREVNEMQSVLSQQEQQEGQLDIPVADAVMEARGKLICARHILNMLPCLLSLEIVE